jgi:hypothetical protein
MCTVAHCLAWFISPCPKSMGSCPCGDVACPTEPQDPAFQLPEADPPEFSHGHPVPHCGSQTGLGWMGLGGTLRPPHCSLSISQLTPEEGPGGSPQGPLRGGYPGHSCSAFSFQSNLAPLSVGQPGTCSPAMLPTLSLVTGHATLCPSSQRVTLRLSGAVWQLCTARCPNTALTTPSHAAMTRTGSELVQAQCHLPSTGASCQAAAVQLCPAPARKRLPAHGCTGRGVCAADPLGSQCVQNPCKMGGQPQKDGLPAL